MISQKDHEQNITTGPRALVSVSHNPCASFPVQPNCEIVVFQVEWRPAVDFHFQLQRCCSVADGDSQAGFQVGQAPRERLVMMHRFVGSNAPGAAQWMMSARMKEMSRVGLKIRLVRDDAFQSLFASSASGCTRIGGVTSRFASMETRAGFSPTVFAGLSNPPVTLAVPNGGSRLMETTTVVPAAEQSELAAKDVVHRSEAHPAEEDESAFLPCSAEATKTEAVVWVRRLAERLAMVAVASLSYRSQQLVPDTTAQSLDSIALEMAWAAQVG